MCENHLPRNTSKAKILQKQELCFTSFQNNTTREVRPKDFDLTNIILTKTNNKILIHCTKNTTILLNKQQQECITNIPILITNISDYEIQGEYSPKRLYSHTITETWNKQLDNVIKSETGHQWQPD